jgi:hypothetical protein
VAGDNRQDFALFGDGERHVARLFDAEWGSKPAKLNFRHLLPPVATPSVCYPLYFTPYADQAWGSSGRVALRERRIVTAGSIHLHVLSIISKNILTLRRNVV